jgi:AcrR family transcriptional regulator
MLRFSGFACRLESSRMLESVRGVGGHGTQRRSSQAARKSHVHLPEKALMRTDATSNRLALISSAKRLFAERGSTAVPYSTIAQAAGVGIGTLYRHFPRPEDLITELVTGTRATVLDMCERALLQMTADPVPGWNAFVDELCSSDAGSFLPAVVADATGNVRDMENLRDDLTAALDELLDLAKKAGLVPVELDAARFLVGIVVLTRPLPGPGPVELDGLAPWLGRIYRLGLRAHGA